jgi:pyruvate kinase
VELPLEQVPLVQKRAVELARRWAKPVIVATQMLESMISAPTPTRAEASDVAGAIYDHVDCVMLSAESASGSYPVEAVAMMHRISLHTEKDHHNHEVTLKPYHHTTVSDAITAAAREITHHLNMRAIITLTDSGNTTYSAAKERPLAPIIALTQSARTARELCLCWGTYSILVEESRDALDPAALVKDHHFARTGDRVIITSGVPFQRGSTHYLKIVDV